MGDLSEDELKGCVELFDERQGIKQKISTHCNKSSPPKQKQFRHKHDRRSKLSGSCLGKKGLKKRKGRLPKNSMQYKNNTPSIFSANIPVENLMNKSIVTPNSVPVPGTVC